MRVTGSTFGCEVPEGWSTTGEPGCVIATAPEPLTGFVPNVVLRESRVEERPDTLAAISQANLRGLREGVPGTLVLEVSAPVVGGLEHRRLLMLSPARPHETHGNAMSVLSLQELVVAEGAVAELTATVPLFDFQPGDEFHRVLDSLVPLPAEERTAPPTQSTVPEPTLDIWASTRDGSPREDLSVVALPTLVLPEEPIALGPSAAEAVIKGADRGLFPRVRKGAARDELAAVELVDHRGNLTSQGFWYASHFRRGQSWIVHTSVPANTHLRFWMTDSSTVFLAPHPTRADRHLLGYDTTHDFFRVLLGWIGHRPSWPLSVQLQASMEQFQATLDEGAKPSADTPDAVEFCAQPWRFWSADNDAADCVITWVNTPSRGDALCFTTPGTGPVPGILVQQDPLDPLWAALIRAIASV